MTISLPNLTTWVLQPSTALADTGQMSAFVAGQAVPEFDVAWKPAAQELQAGWQSPFLLEPRAERYMIGLVAEVHDGTFVLGTAEYLCGSHETIARTIEEQHGAVKSFVWGGELYFRNDSNVPAIGTLTKVNATSGFLHGIENSGDGRVRPDRILEAQKVLSDPRTRLPFRILENVEYLKYDKQTHHLDNIMETFGGDRHNLINWLSEFVLDFELVSTSRDKAKHRPVLAFRKSVCKNDRLDRLRLFCKRFEKEVPELAGQLDGIISQRDLNELSAEDLSAAYKAMEVSFNKMLDVFAAGIEGKSIGRYDLFPILDPKKEMPATPPINSLTDAFEKLQHSEALAPYFDRIEFATNTIEAEAERFAGIDWQAWLKFAEQILVHVAEQHDGPIKVEWQSTTARLLMSCRSKYRPSNIDDPMESKDFNTALRQHRFGRGFVNVIGSGIDTEYLGIVLHPFTAKPIDPNISKYELIELVRQTRELIQETLRRARQKIKDGESFESVKLWLEKLQNETFGDIVNRCYALDKWSHIRLRINEYYYLTHLLDRELVHLFWPDTPKSFDILNDRFSVGGIFSLMNQFSADSRSEYELNIDYNGFERRVVPPTVDRNNFYRVTEVLMDTAVNSAGTYVKLAWQNDGQALVITHDVKVGEPRPAIDFGRFGLREAEELATTNGWKIERVEKDGVRTVKLFTASPTTAEGIAMRAGYENKYIEGFYALNGEPLFYDSRDSYYRPEEEREPLRLPNIPSMTLQAGHGIFGMQLPNGEHYFHSDRDSYWRPERQITPVKKQPKAPSNYLAQIDWPKLNEAIRYETELGTINISHEQDGYVFEVPEVLELETQTKIYFERGPRKFRVIFNDTVTVRNEDFERVTFKTPLPDISKYGPPFPKQDTHIIGLLGGDSFVVRSRELFDRLIQNISGNEDISFIVFNDTELNGTPSSVLLCGRNYGSRHDMGSSHSVITNALKTKFGKNMLYQHEEFAQLYGFIDMEENGLRLIVKGASFSLSDRMTAENLFRDRVRLGRFASVEVMQGFMRSKIYALPEDFYTTPEK